ncbi:hypothetical protein [Epilithonimonas sp.]|uniref:hypothetical protein n=1 Tax=Epilithonimonas sp. TaxID=2894511 RepID=UPI00289F85FC|nr:hypothetical protein [Epilithonimonas sp.]
MNSGSNYGIDGGAILINGNLLSNPSDIELYSKSRKLEVIIVFNQSKTSASFNSGDISKFGSAVQFFFKETSSIALSQELIDLKALYNTVLEPNNIRFIDRKKFPELDLNFYDYIKPSTR